MRSYHNVLLHYVTLVVRRSLVTTFTSLDCEVLGSNSGQVKIWNEISASCATHAPPLELHYIGSSSKPGNSPSASEGSIEWVQVVIEETRMNPMAGEVEWMEKHQGMEGERGKAMDTKTVAHDSRASPDSLETHIMRKWGDIGHPSAVGQRICNTIQYNTI